MRNRILVLVFLCLVFFTGCSQESGPASDPADRSKIEASSEETPASPTDDEEPSEEVSEAALPDPETDLFSQEEREVIMNENLDVALNTEGQELPFNTFLAIVTPDVPQERGAIEEHKWRAVSLQRAKEGKLRLMAPGQPGSYELRLYTGGNDGEVLGVLSFRVKGYDRTKVSIIPDGYRYPLGQDIGVRFEAPPEFAQKAWIGLIPDQVKDESSEENMKQAARWSHINGRDKGEIKLMAPEQPGSYDVRIFDSQDGGRMVKSINIKVEVDGEGGAESDPG